MGKETVKHDFNPMTKLKTWMKLNRKCIQIALPQLFSFISFTFRVSWHIPYLESILSVLYYQFKRLITVLFAKPPTNQELLVIVYSVVFIYPHIQPICQNFQPIIPSQKQRSLEQWCSAILSDKVIRSASVHNAACNKNIGFLTT
jgi:hypothetical protein